MKSLREKCPNTEFFSGTYLDTFHTVNFKASNNDREPVEKDVETIPNERGLKDKSENVLVFFYHIVYNRIGRL